jgi:hypothetical protein
MSEDFSAQFRYCCHQGLKGVESSPRCGGEHVELGSFVRARLARFSPILIRGTHSKLAPVPGAAAPQDYSSARSPTSPRLHVETVSICDALIGTNVPENLRTHDLLPDGNALPVSNRWARNAKASTRFREANIGDVVDLRETHHRLRPHEVV